MTKRFILDDAGELIDMSNHKFIDYGEEVCELLNQISEENEELKISLVIVKENMQLAREYVNELYDENEKLVERNKKRLKRLKNQREMLGKQQEAIWGYKGEIKQLKREKEELKEFIFDLTTKGTGKIDLANGYSYNANIILQDVDTITAKDTVGIIKTDETNSVDLKKENGKND